MSGLIHLSVPALGDHEAFLCPEINWMNAMIYATSPHYHDFDDNQIKQGEITKKDHV